MAGGRAMLTRRSSPGRRATGDSRRPRASSNGGEEWERKGAWERSRRRAACAHHAVVACAAAHSPLMLLLCFSLSHPARGSTALTPRHERPQQHSNSSLFFGCCIRSSIFDVAILAFTTRRSIAAALVCAAV